MENDVTERSHLRYVIHTPIHTHVCVLTHSHVLRRKELPDSTMVHRSPSFYFVVTTHDDFA